MSKILTLLLATIMVFSANAETVEQMLKKADQYRSKEPHAKVTTVVKLYQNNELDKTRLYEVYTRPMRESLVLFRSKVEDGQKLLMLGDNYWLLMPQSRRPIRITPIQKLLGNASVGDISTLNWSEHYQGTLQGDQEVVIQDKKIMSNRLELTAKTAGETYARIELWLDKKNDFPLKADLYLLSGKMAKQAFFIADDDVHPKKIVSMVLLDSIQPEKKTVIDYQNVVPYQLDAKYYNPAYLIQQPRIEL
ncbi:outer membrane lipoprotein-sorting protein [Enterobacter sp. BIGb0383]|uniref:outer membrane lipoprotein-sorting protein n=1 Tax=unclassified Enterobacter TaxID=2608935 RepID=UPI000F4A3D5C|nr:MULTISPECIES: outer membrane lipoprotein-sorting protein [unclassified Enterobacter]ROP59495.1 outer membrane lipoprotein-sorting protein [Enterobacter sp. BIGb0383]ROS09038.1 outer membrane lipoprotein-sorting protein [Enterobacter sp. BIGb0359]